MGPSGKGSGRKSNRANLNCPHRQRKHYAKNMCMSCYHRGGRTKKAWSCPHNHRVHYSKGLCQNCYLADYYQQRKANNLLKPRKKKGAVAA